MSPPNMAAAPAGRTDAAPTTVTVQPSSRPIVSSDLESQAGTYFEVCGYRPDELVSVNWRTITGKMASVFVTVADAPANITQHRDTCCYISGGTWRHRPSSGRGTAGDIARIPALWADLDLDGGFKEGGFADLMEIAAAITEISDLIGAPPAAILLTGGGMQPRWPVTGDIDAETLRRFGLLVEQVCAEHGATCDRVYDMPRMLRAPTSVNHKKTPDGTAYRYGDGPAPTRLLVTGGQR